MSSNVAISQALSSSTSVSGTPEQALILSSWTLLLQAGATAAGTAVQTLKGAGLTAAKTAATQAVSGRRHLLTESVTVSTLHNELL